MYSCSIINGCPCGPILRDRLHYIISYLWWALLSPEACIHHGAKGKWIIIMCFVGCELKEKNTSMNIWWCFLPSLLCDFCTWTSSLFHESHIIKSNKRRIHHEASIALNLEWMKGYRNFMCHQTPDLEVPFRGDYKKQQQQQRYVYSSRFFLPIPDTFTFPIYNCLF